MIVLFTDFGLCGPYVGQMQAVLQQRAPGIPVINLFADAPGFDPRASAYLLAAYATGFPPGSVFLSVVDPGVGGADRLPVVVRADDYWFVGPGNGLFSIAARRARRAEVRESLWRPDRLSATFHGRDLFAPIAAALVNGESVESRPLTSQPGTDWPDDLAEVIYLDHFGNGLTGLRAASVSARHTLHIGTAPLPRVRCFSDVPPGTPLCYENSNGLLEIAVNGGSAAARLGLRVGTPITVA